MDNIKSINCMMRIVFSFIAMIIMCSCVIDSFAVAGGLDQCSCKRVGSPRPLLGSIVLTVPGMEPYGTIVKAEILPHMEAAATTKTWSYESYLLRVTTVNDGVINHPFKAMYGYFNIIIPEKLFGKENEHIIIMRQTAKGTAVNTSVLEVFHVGKKDMRMIYRRTIADYVTISPTVQWEYCVRVANIPDLDPLRADAGIELILSNAPFGATFYPKDRDGRLLPKYLCIALDAGIIKEFLGETCYTAFWARRALVQEYGGGKSSHDSQ